MTATERPSPSEARDWEEMASRPEFQVLRHRLRSFVFPMTGLFLGWYLLYVLLASYAPSFMAIKLFGNINVGLVFGLLQFVSTFLITFLYVRFADRKFDPLANGCRCGHRGRPHRARDEAMGNLNLAQGVEGSNPILNLAIFGLFVVATLAIVIRVSKRATSGASDFHGGQRLLRPAERRRDLGDYLSAASFLGIAGAIAINGYDGFLYSVGFLVAWLVALLLVAELLRNTGKYTMGDVLAFKMRQRPVRAAPRDVHAGRVVLLPARPDGRRGWPRRAAAQHHERDRSGHRHRDRRCRDDRLCAHRRHAWNDLGSDHQGGAAHRGRRDHDGVGAGAQFGFSLSAVAGAAVERAGQGGELLSPGAQYGKSAITRIDFISLGLALVLGTAGLPHILMHFTVPTAKEARRSVVWAIS